ncbi:MAG: ABC transporter permease [Eubacteriales bacterium]|nr:ABC transporter permease [Eubacteriales bacterium]
MSIKRAVLLVILLALIASIYISIDSKPNYLSYVFKAPKAGAEEIKKPNGNTEEDKAQKEKTLALSTTESMLKNREYAKEEWGKDVSAHMLVSIKDGVNVASDQNSAVQARVMGFFGSLHIINAPVLTAGRLLYPEELEDGTAVAVLDEQTAVKLFRTGEPLDRYLKIDNKEFRVVGVIKHTRNAADKEPLRVTVPLLALDEANVQSDVYIINLKTSQGQGAYKKIKSSLEGVQSGGTLYNISKEKQRSLLPIRWGIGFIAILILNVLYKMLIALSKQQFESEKDKLNDKYFQSLLPIWTIKAVLVILMWVVWLFAVYMVLQFMVEPVYVFTEWVPATLVEWADINTAFWNNRNDVTGIVELRTPTIIELRFYHRMLTLLCISVAALLLKPYYQIKQKFE